MSTSTRRGQGLEMIFVRVKLCSTEEDCNKPGHEIVKLNPERSFAEIRQDIRRHFQGFNKTGPDAKVNLKGMICAKGDKCVKVKVIYAGSNTWNAGSGDALAETVLTEDNCEDILHMLKEWKNFNWGHLCVVIAPPVNAGFSVDNEVESEEDVE